MTGPPAETEVFGSGDPAFFTTVDGGWFTPTAASRGPWDPESCHAGPPLGIMARAIERIVTDLRLTRLCVDLIRPIPMSGFRVVAQVVRRSRSVAATRVDLIDGDDRICASGHGLHLTTIDVGAVPTAEVSGPDLAEMQPGRFPIEHFTHDLPMFAGPGLDVGYPPGETTGVGPTTMWMRTIPLIENESPSPFQQMCPLADSGNGISRNAEPWKIGFVNVDVTLALFRDPVGEWLASSAVSHWHSTGIGLADAMLFDEEGPIGRACQALLIRPR